MCIGARRCRTSSSECYNTPMSPLYHSGKALDVVPGWSIFDYADNLRVRVPTSCGRTGECHECIVEVKQGADALSPLTPSEEFLRGNYRLACQAHVVDENADVEFAVLRRQPRILTHSVRRQVDIDPLTSRDGDSVVFRRRAHRHLPGTNLRPRSGHRDDYGGYEPRRP